MLIKYTFVTGETSEVEASAEIGEYITASRRDEASDDRKEHRHCYSLDAITYEGIEYGTEPLEDVLYSGGEETNRRVRRAFAKLTPTQQRRMAMRAKGLSIREIARREGADYSAVKESIHAAEKKFKKFF